MKRKIIDFLGIIALIAVIIAASAFTASADGADETPNVLSVKSDSLKLTVNEKTGCLALEDLRNGDLWLSSPSNAEEDEVASGITRTNMLSCIVVSYKKDNSLLYTNSYTGSVLRGNTTYEAKGKSIVANYKFADQGFTVPVEYSVYDSVFSAEILAEKITEDADFLINTIELLPFFGAGSIKEDGYMLVPDGSGAIINFNNGKTELDQYSKQVYGDDLAIKNDTLELNKQNILLAAFGIKKNSSAFIANISEGAGCAKINAAISGQFCSYNRIYASFCFRNVQSIKINEQTSGGVSGMFSAVNTASSKKFSVNYTILETQRADFSGMAQVTNERLKKSGVDAENKSRVVLDFYGGVQKEKAFLGIRYTGIEQLTSYNDVLNIIADCENAGIENVEGALRYFNADFINGKLSSGFKYSSKLGKKSDYKKLCEKKNIFPLISANKYSKGTLKYNHFFTSALGLDLVSVKLYDYSIQNRAYDEKQNPYYLLPYTQMGKVTKELNKSIKKQNLNGVLLDGLVNMQYSDFSKKGILKDGVSEIVTDMLESIKSKNVRQMMSAPNDYAWSYADVITDLPMTSSGYGLFDYDVPFCQMVLHGLVDYTSASVNLYAMSRQQLLQHIRTGSQLKFSVLKNGGKSITGTELEYLNAADFNNLKKAIFDWYETVNGAAEKILDAGMISYSENNGVSATKYDNGVTVYVNTTDEESIVNQTKIPAMDYVIVSE